MSDDEKPALKMPEAWTKQDRGAVKSWSAGRRTDDPGQRAVLEPLAAGLGDGKAVLFLFGFKVHSERDQDFLRREVEHLGDDVETLRRAGYRVVIDRQATRQDFLDAVAGRAEGASGLTPAAIYWSAHGHEDGSVETCDGGAIRPVDVETVAAAPGLRLVIFASCYVGCRSRTWRKALGGHPLIVGWGRPVTIDRAVEFLQPNVDTLTDLDDLIRRYLLADGPLPRDDGAAFAPAADAASAANLGDVPERLKTVTEMLGARARPEERWVLLHVPIEDGRRHVAKVFVIDSSEPYAEGERLLAVEADVGEITDLVDPTMLLSGLGGPGYARVALVKGPTEMPRIVTQGFLPLARVRDQDLAALVFQVCAMADRIERRIFGGDLG